MGDLGVIKINLFAFQLFEVGFKFLSQLRHRENIFRSS